MNARASGATVGSSSNALAAGPALRSRFTCFGGSTERSRPIGSPPSPSSVGAATPPGVGSDSQYWSSAATVCSGGHAAAAAGPGAASASAAAAAVATLNGHLPSTIVSTRGSRGI